MTKTIWRWGKLVSGAGCLIFMLGAMLGLWSINDTALSPTLALMLGWGMHVIVNRASADPYLRRGDGR